VKQEFITNWFEGNLDKNVHIIELSFLSNAANSALMLRLHTTTIHLDAKS